MLTRSAYLVAMAALAAAMPALASDHMNLDEDLPLRTEDAYPIAYQGREFQIIGRYDRHVDDSDDDQYTVLPRLEVGLFRNMQVSLSAPFYFGEADTTHSGDIDVGALYNFNTETLGMPAMALAAHAVAPTGEDSQGVDTTLKFIAHKTISDEHLDRVYLNVAYSRKINPEENERHDRYMAAIGYSRRITADVILLVDLVREQELEEHKEASFLEVGARIQLDPLTTFSIGGGPGIGDESPDFRITVGLQRSF